jgi:small GTP-binding protein
MLDRLKISVVGFTGVGKTSILQRFMYDSSFASTPTLGVDYFTYDYKYNGQYTSLHNGFIKFSIWDLAGREEFKKITKPYLSSSQGLILVFDLNNPESFTKLDDWLTDAKIYISFKNEKNNNLTGMLLGNKNDLNPLVSSDKAQEWARKNGFKYFEVSTKTNTSTIRTAINDFFHTMVDVYHDQIKREPAINLVNSDTNNNNVKYKDCSIL